MEQGVLRCRQVGDRAELTMEVPGPGQGLYRGYALGEGGQMDLGTLLPEGGGRRLHRTGAGGGAPEAGVLAGDRGKGGAHLRLFRRVHAIRPQGLDRAGPAGDLLPGGPRPGPGGPGARGGRGLLLPAGGAGCSVWPGPGIPGGPSPWSPPSAWPRSRAWGGGGMWSTTLPQRGGPLWRERPRRVRPPACRRCRAGSTAPGRPEVPRGCLAR